jgi:hypothetical protein
MMFRIPLFLTTMMGFIALVHAQSVDPAEDEARIEQLIRLRADALREATEKSKSVPYGLPPPVVAVPEASKGIPPGPITFDQLAAVTGRWIVVRLRSGSVRSGELISVKGNDFTVKIGSGAQGATLPLNKKNIKSVELVQ